MDLRFTGSGLLESGSYDEVTGELTVKLRGGKEYTHHGVSRDVVDRLRMSPSPGSFWRKQVCASRVDDPGNPP